jgi:hypothetical protein
MSKKTKSVSLRFKSNNGLQQCSLQACHIAIWLQMPRLLLLATYYDHWIHFLPLSRNSTTLQMKITHHHEPNQVCLLKTLLSQSAATAATPDLLPPPPVTGARSRCHLWVRSLGAVPKWVGVI